MEEEETLPYQDDAVSADTQLIPSVVRSRAIHQYCQ